SLKVVANHLRLKGAEELKVCTIYLKPQRIFHPDFYAMTTRKWIIFPWERLEAVRLIAQHFNSDRAKVSSVVRELKGSGISSRLVRLVWSIFSYDGRDSQSISSKSRLRQRKHSRPREDTAPVTL